jgi:hypothetical protein
MRAAISLLYLLMIVNGCVEPFNLKSSSYLKRLIVDGEITDQPGPYKVKLSYSKNVLDTETEISPAVGSSVWIEDSEGVEELLTGLNGEEGTYITKDIQGVVGKSYRVKIITQSGGKYESTWERIEPAGQIEDFYYEFNEDLITPDAGKKYDYVDGFKFFINASSNTESNGLLRWRWTGIYKIASAPERNTKFVGRAELPNPLPCSGYIVSNGRLTQVDECTCCICWGYDYGTNVIVSDNANISTNNFKEVLVGQVLISRPRFYERYYAEVEQLSVSENVYAFWKLLGDQQKATGSLFQSNSVRIKGNIVSTIDSEEEVLGVFSASSVVKKSIYIDENTIPYVVAEMDFAPQDCRKSVNNGSTTKPDFW